MADFTLTLLPGCALPQNGRGFVRLNEIGYASTSTTTTPPYNPDTDPGTGGVSTGADTGGGGPVVQEPAPTDPTDPTTPSAGGNVAYSYNLIRLDDQISYGNGLVLRSELPLVIGNLPDGRYGMTLFDNDVNNQGYAEFAVACAVTEGDLPPPYGLPTGVRYRYTLRTVARGWVYHLRTQGQQLLYHLRTRLSGRVYHLHTQARVRPWLRYPLRTLTRWTYHLRTGAALEPQRLLVEITSNGRYLHVIVPKPTDDAGNVVDVLPGVNDWDHALRTVPVVQARLWSAAGVGEPLEGRLIAPDYNDPQGFTAWRFVLGILPRDGVYTVDIYNVGDNADAQQPVLACLRLQREEARQLLLPEDDYNEAAADLEVWLGAAALAYEAQAYAEADYILSELCTAFLPLNP